MKFYVTITDAEGATRGTEFIPIERRYLVENGESPQLVERFGREFLQLILSGTWYMEVNPRISWQRES